MTCEDVDVEPQTPEERAKQAIFNRHDCFLADPEKLVRDVAAQIRAAVADEREACATALEGRLRSREAHELVDMYNDGIREAIATIRARGGA